MRFLLSCLLLWFSNFAPAQVAGQPGPELFNGLRWRSIGPFRGGRVLGVSGVPGQPNTFYFGSVGGGVWKSTDAGMAWNPVFDAQRIASIGALAVAPSNPEVVYAGTGEADMRSDISFGDGVYRSNDGGKTWAQAGLRDSRQIGRIVVDPKNADVAWAAALGHAYGPNAERGVFKTTDGGRTWRKVLDRGPDVGAIDVALDPENPEVVYAAMWRARRPPWSTYAPLSGPGSGLYKSTDGGETWNELRGRGLPAGDWGRVGVGVARGRRIYALIEAGTGGLYRSDDAGENWARAGVDERIETRAWYFSEVIVDPHNADVVYLPNVALYKSTDGGKTFGVLRGAPGGDDYHSLWIDPADSARMILGSDQGASISVDGGKTWSTWYNQPTGQFYHVITDNQFPYFVYGAQQDSGTAAVASRTDHGQITARDWFSVGGAESGYIAPDPRDPNLVYVGNGYGTLTRFDRRTSQGQIVTPWPAPSFLTRIDRRKYRFPWTAPLKFSPLDPGTLYYGAQFLLVTTDGGLHWRGMSPDLTGGSRPMDGEPSVENAKAGGFGTIYTIAPSPVDRGTIWTGSDTGLIHVTRNGGKTWVNVTPPGLTDWSKVTHIEASHFEAGEAYAAVDRHRLDDYRPYLYRTRDFGKTWTAAVEGLREPGFLNAVREDPARRGLLFAATELGVAVSFDDGDHWLPLRLNLPTTSVRDLVVHRDDLAIATHGRGLWILDNIEPLRQAREAAAAPGEAYLFQPTGAIRMTSEGFQGTPLPPEEPTAPNPPAGAAIDYFLRSASGEVTLEILDSSGGLVRRYSSLDAVRARAEALPIAERWLPAPERLSGAQGMHRFVWDLRYGAGEAEETGRDARGATALPGRYQVRLTAAGGGVTRPLTVTLDPRSTGKAADLAARFELASRAAAARSSVGGAIRGLRAIRAQLAERKGDEFKALEVDAEKIAAALTADNGDLSAVLEVAESADRTPPAQAYALFDEAERAARAHTAAYQAFAHRVTERH